MTNKKGCIYNLNFNYINDINDYINIPSAKFNKIKAVLI